MKQINGPIIIPCFDQNVRQACMGNFLPGVVVHDVHAIVCGGL